MTVSQNDIHMIGGRNANGQLLKSVEYCEPGVIGKWKKVIGLKLMFYASSGLT